MNEKPFQTLFKIGIIVLLILIVLVVLIIKNKKPRDIAVTDVSRDSSAGVDSIVKQDSLFQITKTDTSTISLPPNNRLFEKEMPSLPEKVLAKVNDEAITIAQFDSMFSVQPAQTRDYFEDDKAGFLEELIIRQLLLQDAHRNKIQDTPEYKSAIAEDSARIEDVMINVLLRNIVAGTSVTETELREFFVQYKDQLPNKDYESIHEQLRPMALEEKQRMVIEDYIDRLKSSAKIVRNEEWIKSQAALLADNPLSSAFGSGKPVVADFGRGTCVPCKMMEPILKKLQKDYEGRASVLIIDVGEYASLSRKYGVRIIPTQIFFDATGKEVYRHQGFMPEGEIVVQLRNMGVE